MGRNHRTAAREADSLCKPTCPDVDESFALLASTLRDLVPPLLVDDAETAIAVCCAKVKERGTERLRDALVDACAGKQEAEELHDDAAREVAALRDEIAGLRAELADALRAAA